MASYTYKATGNREDLCDFITNISPDENFLQGRFGRTTVTGMSHDWLCDSLRPAGANRQVEDVTFSTQEAVARIRLNNFVQQFLVGYKVTDAQEAVLKAGIKSEIAYQMVKATKELSRDLEMAVLKQNQAIASTSGTGGQFGGVRFFTGGDATPAVHTTGTFTFANHKLQTGGQVVFYILPAGTMFTGVTAGQVYYVRVIDANTFTVHPTAQDAQANANKIVPTGTPVNCYITRSNVLSMNGALTEGSFNDMMQICWKQGASIESAVMSGKNKRLVSTWTSGVQRTADMNETKRKNIVEIYETDFGLVNMEAHRQQDDDRIDFFQFEHWKLAYLKPFHVEDVPRKGTFTEKVITGMVTLENRSPISNGAIINIQ